MTTPEMANTEMTNSEKATPELILPWDRPCPFTLNIIAEAHHIDRLGHVNNTHYVQWMQTISWQHVETIGMGWAIQEQESCAMAIMRTELDYLASAYSEDRLIMGTWITDSDNRLRSSREFQLIRIDDKKTLLRATCRYACIDLKKGKPARMPEAFIKAHQFAIRQHSPH